MTAPTAAPQGRPPARRTAVAAGRCWSRRRRHLSVLLRLVPFLLGPLELLHVGGRGDRAEQRAVAAYVHEQRAEEPAEPARLRDLAQVRDAHAAREPEVGEQLDAAKPAARTISRASQARGPGRTAASRISTLMAPGKMSAWGQVCFPTAGSISRAKDVMKTYVITFVSQSMW